MIAEPGLVSIIVPVFNRSVMLVDAVNSVLQQSYRPVEIIIVDDGSTDDTPLVAALLKERHPREVFVVRQDNGGVGRARETGRLLARGEYIQYLDSDDQLVGDKFGKSVRLLTDRPDYGAVYGISRLVDESNVVIEEPYRRTGEEHEELLPYILLERWWNTNSPLYRRSVCDAVGAWSNMRIYEDWEYDARVAKLGVRLGFIPEPFAAFREHSHERLTGRPVTTGSLSDLRRLLVVLWDLASCHAGHVPREYLRTFGRWAFLSARQCGELGMSEPADELLKIACNAASACGSSTVDMRVYAGCARLFGHPLCGRLSSVADRTIRAGYRQVIHG